MADELVQSTAGNPVGWHPDVGQAAAGWLLGYRSPHTRAAYAGDLAHWLDFCRDHGLDPLGARRGHVDAWARHLEAVRRAPATVARKLSAVASWYRWLVNEGLLGASPVDHVRRPKVGDDSATLGPTLDEARTLLAAADADGLKAAGLVRLLLVNGLRVSEALQANGEDLGVEHGHRVLRVRRKAGRVAVVPLAPGTADVLDALTANRDRGPIFLGEHGGRGPQGRLTRSGAAHIVERVARAGDLEKHLSPHSLRHGFVTLALEAGVALVDVQDAAGHADPRTTRRYDRARHRLDAAPTYALAAALTDRDAA